MAKKSKKKSGTTVTVQRPRASSPRPSGGAVVVVREKAKAVARRVGARASGASATSFEKSMQGGAIGGFGLGMVEKHFPQLPTIPMLGRKGTIALVGYMMKPKHPIVRDIVFAAAVLSGYEFGKDSKVTGYEDE